MLSWLAWVGCASAVSAPALVPPPVPPPPPPQQQQHNVLYFIVDDLRPEFMTAYGQSQMLTPNVDKLAQSGTVFRNAHCQQAVCGPSRAR